MEIKIKITFRYEDIRIHLECSKESKMETVFEEFVKQLNPESKLIEYSFFYDEKLLDPKTTFEQNKELFCDKNEPTMPKELSIHAVRNLRIIKCPKCNYNDCIINLQDYQISYYGCEHKHSFSSMYDDYFKQQIMDNSTIKCCQPNCKHTQKNDPLDFAFCLTCSKMLINNKTYCKGCSSNHKEDHVLVKWIDKDYYCTKHFNRVDKYCFKCKENICKECKKEHSNHKVKSYDLMTPNDKEIDDLEKKLVKINKIIEDLEYVVTDIIYKLNGSVKMFKNYSRIAKDVIEKYKMFNKDFKNYEILKSIRNIKISNGDIFQELNSIIEKKDSKTQAGILIDIYMKRKNRYYGDITTNPLNEETDDKWIKDIEEKEKKALQSKAEAPPKKNNNK